MGQQVLRLAGLARPLMAGWWWPLLALAVGSVPLAVCHALGTSLHHLLTALLLAPLVWACIGEDRQFKAVATVALVMAAHSALAIYLAAVDPAGTARVLPESDLYWQRTLHWVRTGEDPSYVLANWGPDHLLLLLGLTAGSYTSLGLIPLLQGLRQLDLMNYYVGRLMTCSQSPLLTLLVGWHPWSVLRGLGYTFLLYEIASLSLERFSGQTLSTPRRRWLRWTVGIGLCLGDALVKFGTADAIRTVLAGNLLPEMR